MKQVFKTEGNEMKILSLVATALLLLSTTFINAQEQEKDEDFRSFYVGIAACPQINWMNSDNGDMKRDGIRFTINPAAYVDIQLWQNFYFSTGLGLNYQGSPIKINDHTYDSLVNFSLESVKRVYKIGYLEVPVKIKAISDIFGNWRFKGEFGVNIDILLSAKRVDKLNDVTFSVEGTSPSQNRIVENADISITDNIKDDVNFLNIVGTLGLGAECKISKTMGLTMGASYNLGFTNILSSKHDKINDSKAVAKNNYIQLSVGIIF